MHVIFMASRSYYGEFMKSRGRGLLAIHNEMV